MYWCVCLIRGCLCLPYIDMPPICSYTPLHLYATCTTIWPPYTIMFPICHGNLGASICPIWHGVFWGISTSVIHFCVCQCIMCPSVHNGHTSCSPALWVTSLMNLMPLDVYSASFYFFFISIHLYSTFRIRL